MRRCFLSLVLTPALILVNGCGTGDNVRAKNALEASRATYERCLEQNPSDHSKCESLKRKYEEDLRAYLEEGRRTSPIVTGFIEFGH